MHDLHAVLLLRATVQMAPMHVLILFAQISIVPRESHSYGWSLSAGPLSSSWSRWRMWMQCVDPPWHPFVPTVVCSANGQNERCLEAIKQQVIS